MIDLLIASLVVLDKITKKLDENSCLKHIKTQQKEMHIIRKILFEGKIKEKWDVIKKV